MSASRPNGRLFYGLAPKKPLMRLKLVIAYKGTDFQGWQIQEKESAPPTVQGEIEKALYKITSQKIRIFGAGRTDSGVHAFGQAAHFDFPEDLSARAKGLRESLNALLPASVRILSAERADAGFHARKDAAAKTYIYNFWTEPAFTPPHLADFAWSCGRLDADLMRACLPALLGEHDFSSFQNAGTPVESAIRRVHSIRLDALPQAEFFPAHAPLLRLSITANGFLKQMARNIAGLLWKAGRGALPPEAVRDIIEARKRAALNAPTAPAKGLCLARTHYGRDRDGFAARQPAYLSPTIKAWG